MRTSKHSKPEIALVCDLIPHSIISYQASELHQKRYRWRTLEKAETKLCVQCTSDRDAEKTLHLAQTIEETHPVERELQREKRTGLLFHQVGFRLLSVPPTRKLLSRVRQRYQKRGRPNLRVNTRSSFVQSTIHKVRNRPSSKLSSL